MITLKDSDHPRLPCCPPLPRETELELIEAAQAGSEDAKSELYHQFFNVILKICNRYPIPHTSLDDRLSEAAVAFMDTIRRFDPAKGTRFTTILALSVTHRLWQIDRNGAVKIPEAKWDSHRPCYHPVFPSTASTEHEFYDDTQEHERKLVHQAVEQIKGRDQLVARMMLKGMLQRDMAPVLGISRARTSQIVMRTKAALIEAVARLNGGRK